MVSWLDCFKWGKTSWWCERGDNEWRKQGYGLHGNAQRTCSRQLHPMPFKFPWTPKSLTIKCKLKNRRIHVIKQALSTWPWVRHFRLKPWWAVSRLGQVGGRTDWREAETGWYPKAEEDGLLNQAVCTGLSVCWMTEPARTESRRSEAASHFLG